MSTISSNSAASLQLNYMNLLITQLQHQDPLNPMDNNQMAGQLAQLSQLQQMETMNSTFGQVLVSSQMSYATSLLGKEVTYVPAGQTEALTGQVQGVKVVDGELRVTIGANDVDPSLITGIRDVQTQQTP